MHVNTLETDLEREERRKNISGNASLFILFVCKKGCQKEAFAKVSPFFLMFCKNASIFHFTWEKREQKGWKTREFVYL